MATQTADITRVPHPDSADQHLSLRLAGATKPGTGKGWEKRYDWVYPEWVDPYGKAKQRCEVCGTRGFSLKYGKCFQCQRGWFPRSPRPQQSRSAMMHQALVSLAADVVAEHDKTLGTLVRGSDGRLSQDYVSSELGIRRTSAKDKAGLIDSYLPDWAYIEHGTQGDKVRNCTRLVFRNVPKKVLRAAHRMVSRLLKALAGRYTRVNPGNQGHVFQKERCKGAVLRALRGSEEPNPPQVIPEGDSRKATSTPRAVVLLEDKPTYLGKPCRHGHRERVTRDTDERKGGECNVCPPKLVGWRVINGVRTKLIGAMRFMRTCDLSPARPTRIVPKGETRRARRDAEILRRMKAALRVGPLEYDFFTCQTFGDKWHVEHVLPDRLRRCGLCGGSCARRIGCAA